MLKWTVVKRDAFTHLDTQRRSSLGGCTTAAANVDSTQKTKRRRSSTGRRRSTGGNQRRNSLGLDLDKENHFTSTPIKDEGFQADAFRDVSNLTPKNVSRGTRRRSDCKKSLYSPKKKKTCLEKPHISEDFLLNLDNTNYFKPFEAVDSHIEGSYHPAANKDAIEVLGDCGCQYSKTPISKRYAPTLPTFALDYSPTPVVCNTTLCQPKIDHVNDFLQRISMITSPDELKMRLPGYRPKPKLKVSSHAVETPSLVKRFIDSRRFASRNTNADNSSFINDLSIDKIVDAILDSSASDPSGTESSQGDIPDHYEKEENECNRTKEENFINAQQCQSGNTSRTSGSSIITTSTDSGFRSSTTEISHDTVSISSRKNPNSDLEERTMINLEGTFNERCVDITCRKRPQVETNEEPQLKRQKCIRQKRPVKKACNDKESESVNDHSFDSEATVEVDENVTYVVTSPEIVKSTSTTNCSNQKNVPPRADEEYRGIIDLDVQYKPNENELSVSVFRCADLKRHNGQPVNAYIKVALGERCSDGRRKPGTVGNGSNAGSKRGVSLQRTAVQPESSTPLFGHTFRVPLQRHPEPAMLYVEAWHRDRITRRSEFLGCASFTIKDALTKIIKGTYKLLPQWSDAHAPNVNFNNNSNNNNHLPLNPKQGREENMADALQTSIDELIAGEHGLVDGGGADQKKHKAALSEQQKVADENLFLRYLELDPMEGPEAAPALAQRKASGNKTTGRTPFTMTRVLRRAPKSGFGFSVVWTHPPRIERVERNLPADKAGIQPGDYLIFVDKHNVVMMPEIEILDLIRSQGNTLTLETFRRDGNRNGNVLHAERPLQTRTMAQIERSERTDSVSTSSALQLGSSTALALGSTTGLPHGAASSMTSVAATSVPHTAPRRPSTVCSTNTASVEYSRKKLHLPQVTFSSERPTTSAEEARRKAMYQLIAREQQYTTSMQFALTRYVQSLLERKDLIAQHDHRILFQNSDELLRISEEIIDHLIQVDGDYHTGSLLKIYASKLNEIAGSYKRYCSGIKKADCVLANLMKNPEFSRFITIPAIPRRRPDLTAFIHKPLEHYREILKLFNVILTNTKANQKEEYNLVNHIVHELQVNYREMTSQAGLMEPVGEGRPLLSVQDLETRLVFTKCKPFVLSKPGRQWIFGGDLSRVEGRTVRQYWALLFSDILLFAKISRDRVLFILEEPLPLAHISDMYFNVRKKENEFRLIVEPGTGVGNRNTAASSPTVHCGPDLTRTPRKNSNKRCIILRTPTVELKAVWQNLLQRQIFHIGASAGDGSAFSSPLDSPDCCQPITSSVVTLQSAESLSRHHPHHAPPSSSQRQPPPTSHPHQQAHAINTNNANPNERESRKRLDELIEHKCKQLEKSSSSSKSNAIHLEQWMKGQFNGDSTNNNLRNLDDTDNYDDLDDEDDIETWTEEQIRKRSEELRIVDAGRVSTMMKRTESRCEDLMLAPDDDQSPSRSTNTTESQVTVRSSAAIAESVAVCKNCHRNCYSQRTEVPMANGYKSHTTGTAPQAKPEDDDDDWRPLMLMGLSAVNPMASLVKLDPFSMPVPKISVMPATPTPTESYIEQILESDCNCNCPDIQPQLKGFELPLNKSYENSPEDSPVNEADEQPYHSLHSSNLTLRRFGTVSSLERVGSEEEAYDVNSENSEDNDIKTTELAGIDNEGFNNTIMTWTARAGSFVAAKMAFLEKLPDYLKNDILNGEDIQEEETSGGTSGEEIWGTPTSGGELDDPLSSPHEYDHQSPNGGSLSSNEDTELMMDELLMTPPVTSSNIRGLLPRRTLEPLMEEEFSDTYTTSESSASSSPTPTEPSVSPEQGSETGGAADECLSAAARPSPPSSTTNGARTSGGGVPKSSSGSGTRLGVASLRSTATTPLASARTSIAKAANTLAAARRLQCTSSSLGCDSNSIAVTNSGATGPCPTAMPTEPETGSIATQPAPIFIKRSDSYQKIIEAADDNVGFFTRFRNRPSMKYLSIERIPPSKGVKFLEFFNVRRERKIYETFPGGKHLIKVFSREGDDSDDVPTSYSDNPEFRQRIKQERQLDRRFWKQLSKRRNSNSPNRQTNSTTSSSFSPSPVLASEKKHVQPMSA